MLRKMTEMLTNVSIFIVRTLIVYLLATGTSRPHQLTSCTLHFPENGIELVVSATVCRTTESSCGISTFLIRKEVIGWYCLSSLLAE